MSRDDIFARALDLPAPERRALALELLQTVEDTPEDTGLDPTIEAAWYAEVQRRRKLIDSGEMKLIPWEEVRKELFSDEDE